MAWTPTIGGTGATLTTAKIDAIITQLSTAGGDLNMSGFGITNLASITGNFSIGGSLVAPIGIGTATPGFPLEVAIVSAGTGISVTGHSPIIRLANISGVNPNGGTGILWNAFSALATVNGDFGPGIAGDMLLGTLSYASGYGNAVRFCVPANDAGSPSIAMSILRNGNVGVNTLTPARNLHIGSVSTGGGLYVSGSSPSISLGNNDVLASATENSIIGMATTGGDFGLPNAGDVLFANFGTGHGNIYINPNLSGSGKSLILVGTQTFASDSAAGTGGLVTGAIYKDSSGGVHIKL